MQVILRVLIQELHRYAKNNRYQRAVVGLSGGLDSAVVLFIAVRAFGPQNVTALIMPELGLTSNDDIDHAKLLAKHLGAVVNYQPINNFLVDFNFLTWEKNETANENLKARMRSMLLQHYSESQNTLFVGTANKSDLLLGYGSATGEFMGDIHILGDLYKSKVQDLAEHIGLPEALLKKEPTRKLKPNQTDEKDLSAPWNKIDEALKLLLEDVDPEVLIEKGMDSLLVHKILRLIQQNKGKYKHLNIVIIGSISEAIKKAQEAEASSMS